MHVWPDENNQEEELVLVSFCHFKVITLKPRPSCCCLSAVSKSSVAHRRSEQRETHQNLFFIQNGRRASSDAGAACVLMMAAVKTDSDSVYGFAHVDPRSVWTQQSEIRGLTYHRNRSVLFIHDRERGSSVGVN